MLIILIELTVEKKSIVNNLGRTKIFIISIVTSPLYISIYQSLYLVKENGVTTKRMVKENILGLMADPILAILKMDSGIKIYIISYS